jgi:hypothetical protein
MRENMDFASEACKIHVFSIFPLPKGKGVRRMGLENDDFEKWGPKQNICTNCSVW